MTRVLGLDLGVSGARAAVVDDTGTSLGSGRAECRHHAHGARIAEHDPRTWLDEVDAAARQATAAAGIDDVDAIAVGALGPAPVLLDAALEPLLPAPLFSMDAGAESFRRELAVDRGDVGPDHVFPRLLAWSATQRSTVERAACVVDATGYVVSSLVGRPVMDRITAADYVLADVRPVVPAPEPEEPTAIAGELGPSAAERLGVRSGTPVAVGTYDTFVDVAALPARPDDVTILLGSTLVLGTVTDGSRVPDGLRASPHIGDGTFVGGWTSTAGSAVDWALSLFAGDRTAVLDEVTALEPGAGGVLALPYLAGERAPVWDPHAAGVIIGLTLGTTPTQVVRALVDGVALSALDLFGRLRSLVGDEPRVWIAGGGVRNAGWLAATVDALGAPAKVVLLGDGVAAARFAFLALGDPLPDIEFSLVEPDLARHARFAELFALYERLYPAHMDAMHALDGLARRTPSPPSGAAL
jgi:xylulokinase